MKHVLRRYVQRNAQRVQDTDEDYEYKKAKQELQIEDLNIIVFIWIAFF